MDVLKLSLAALIGLFLGLTAGLLLPVGVPPAWVLYAGVALLALLSALVRAVASGLGEHFSLTHFLAEALGGGLLAVALCWLGDRLAIPFWLAAVVYFGVSILVTFLSHGGRYSEKEQQSRHVAHDFHN